jgi:iron complex outermembrane receptor protein
VGGSTKLTDDLAIRLDVSRTATDGYIHNTPGNSFDGTLTLAWKPTSNLDIQFSLDVLQDHPSGYWGTPLVTDAFATSPLKNVVTTTNGYTLDSRLKSINYNVGDYRIGSHQYWPQLFVKWAPTDNLTFENYLYYFHAQRSWKDSESYSFDPATNLIDRDRFYVAHDQDLIGDQASASYFHDIFGMKNQLVVGVDYSHLHLIRSRAFPDGDSVDPFNPSPGLFGPIVPINSLTRWDDTALFFEDILNLTSKLKLVTGGRYDYLDLVRKNYNADGSYDPDSSFSAIYQPFTYRAGLVYDINQYVTPYVSYTTGQDPVGSNIFTVDADQNFSLGHSTQIEAGIKASALDNRASGTIAIYDIKRKNVLQAISPDVSVPIGSESSKGVEATADFRINKDWTVNTNLAYTDAKYGQFAYVDGNGNLIDASGNEIPNSPKWLANLWTSYTNVAGLPLEIGAGVRFVGARAGNDAGTLKLDRYTTLNAYVTYSLTPKVDISFRVDNLTDKTYAQSADISYPTEVLLGRPRFFQVDIAARF